jgi:hypothetical protein
MSDGLRQSVVGAVTTARVYPEAALRGRSMANGAARLSLPSKANPCGSVPPFHVHNDGQMTVRRSWNRPTEAKNSALTCNSE